MLTWQNKFFFNRTLDKQSHDRLRNQLSQTQENTRGKITLFIIMPKE